MGVTKKIIFFLLGSLFFGACQPSGGGGDRVFFDQPPSEDFKGYWYKGLAELSSFSLSQNRYRDNHPGEVVLIFVTENFLTEEQVKDEGKGNGNSTSVLKTNMVRRFSTGLYDYSIMTSVFTPVEAGAFPNTLKMTHSSQDWCGQTFMQVNERRGSYRVRVFSYFEAEGDEDVRSPALPLEDELFNRLRLGPERLPLGRFPMYPSATFCRLNHLAFQAREAEAELRAYGGDHFSGQGLREYVVRFPELDRTVAIVFQDAFPYRIEGWTETYPSLLDGELRTTVAQRRQTIMKPYWSLNRAGDVALRDSLGVQGF